MAKQNRKQEKGIALLIAIFVLLLISVVAIALASSAGTESALAGNYRLSTTAHYAALAGLEEARGRLLPSSPNYFGAAFVPPPGAVLPVGQVRYILNPAPGEVVAPQALASANTYPDNEYGQEFPTPITGAVVLTTNSTTPLPGGTPGPSYKWVRITAATERSLGLDVDNDGVLDNVRSLFYDFGGVPKPTLVLPALATPTIPPNSTSMGVFEITALSVVPGGGEQLLQYVVTPVTYGLNFPSALTLPGNQVNFGGANSNQYRMDGIDGQGNPGVLPGCTANHTPVPSIGVTNTATTNNVNNVINGTGVAPYTGIPANRTGYYTGATSPTNPIITSPSVADVSLASNLQTPDSLNQMVQTIKNNADLVVPHDATPADFSSLGMSASNPQTIVVDGNFSMSSNFTGYGLLVVTGNFAYSGTTGWKGIILVIGDGTTTFLGNGGGNNEFDGAILVATTRDAAGNQLSSLGTVDYDISGGGGNGIYFNSCWIKQAQKPPTYKVLSFREIPYND